MPFYTSVLKVADHTALDKILCKAHKIKVWRNSTQKINPEVYFKFLNCELIFNPKMPFAACRQLNLNLYNLIAELAVVKVCLFSCEGYAYYYHKIEGV